MDKLPRVTQKNVLVLECSYLFENYFLNPQVMTQLRFNYPEQLYEILLKKWKEYLHRIRSGRQLVQILGKDLETTEDIKAHMEDIKIYLRGHNLYDIFYGLLKTGTGTFENI